MRNGILFIAVSGLFMVTACKKEKITPADCQRLQNGVVTSGKEEVKAVISSLISHLSSSTYTQQNLSKLADAINQQCGIASSVSCFDCIKTLPSQSEIRISCSTPGGVVERTIDISYTTNNEMVFNNLHY